MTSLSLGFREPAWGAAVPLRIVAAYLFLYLALDWTTFTHPMVGLDLTPWNPQSALAVGLMLWRPGAWWLAWLGAGAAQAVAQAGPAQSWVVDVVASGLVTLGQAITAAALARWLGRRPHFMTRRHFAVFFVIIGVGALVTALLHVAALWTFDVVRPDRVAAAIHRAWIGDLVGLIVALPMLLVLATRESRASALVMLRSLEWWLVALISCGVIVAMVARPVDEQFKIFYLLFIPVVWAAARFGVVGAASASALVQVMFIAAVQASTYRPLTVFELQTLMAALAATGLLLGTTVDEREETAAKLRASLRQAAAGDMAAALAHELNQPLAALSTYARASQLLAERLGHENQALAQPLIDVTGKLVNEAARAGDVVKRLRDFFRNRTTELQLVPPARLIEKVMAAKQLRADAVGARLEWSCDRDVPAVWLDEVQIAVVLRNLLANALDSAARPGATATPVATVRCRVEGAYVILSVLDNGPGIDPSEVDSVFEQRHSEKPGGMGVGLVISRSIVEAHGGRMWAEPGPGGSFHFSLPTASPRTNE